MFLLRTNPTRIFTPAELKGKRFDIRAILQNEKAEDLRPLIVSALENALGITVKRVIRETDVYVLSAPKVLTGSLRPSQAKSFHFSDDTGVTAAAAANLDKLAVAIEMVIGRR